MNISVSNFYGIIFFISYKKLIKSNPGFSILLNYIILPTCNVPKDSINYYECYIYILISAFICYPNILGSSCLGYSFNNSSISI